MPSIDPRRRPAILASLRSADLEQLEQELARLERAGVDALHVDVMDGVFVRESCFEPAFVARLRRGTRLPIDVHLMVDRPGVMAPVYAESGAHRVSFHVEASRQPATLLRQLREEGVEAGMVLLPSTPIESVLAWLPELAVVNPLGVDPVRGLGFQETTYERIAALREHIDREKLSCRVQADGGVWEKTRPGLVAAGADELVAGYPIFSNEDYEAAVRALREGGES